jgi:hypothetical protein
MGQLWAVVGTLMDLNFVRKAGNFLNGILKGILLNVGVRHRHYDVHTVKVPITTTG